MNLKLKFTTYPKNKVVNPLLSIMDEFHCETMKENELSKTLLSLKSTCKLLRNIKMNWKQLMEHSLMKTTKWRRQYLHLKAFLI